MVNQFIKNYNVVNAYVDTTLINRSGTVIVSGFSSDDGNTQEVVISDYFRITTNDGYQFNLDDLENLSFEVQFQNNLLMGADDSEPFIPITLNDFVPVVNYESDTLENNTNYPLWVSIERDNSMIYHYTKGNSNYAILLYGGIRKNDLVFFALKEVSRNARFNIDGKGYTWEDFFSADVYSVNTGDYESFNFLENLNFVAIPETDTPIEDTSKYLFNTYFIDNSELSIIANQTAISSEIIGNTYSYPINFNDEDLIDVDFKVVGITQDIKAKRFLKNLTAVKIFEFTVPDVSNVSESYLTIPFNTNVTLNYEDIKGKVIEGFFIYEILTNTTTLKITANDLVIYYNIVGIGVDMPFRPTGQLVGDDVSSTRLALQQPSLYLKGVGTHVKGNYLKGFIDLNKSSMLDSEKVLLDELIKEGVFIDD